MLKGTQQGIPTLEQVVAACPNVVHWQFEIKTLTTNPGFLQPMAQLIERFGLQDKVVITSKHIGILRAFKRSIPHIERGYVQEWPLPNGLRTALALECTHLCLNKSLARLSYVQKAQRKGLKVSVWTVNDADDMCRLFNYKVDSIISDFPQAAREVINSIKPT
jgi:glycerophosphoryl diester phosphodiesterase